MGFQRARAVAGRWDEVEATGSTNADLVAAVRDGAVLPHLSVRITGDQRAGRGRLDRVWQAPPGAALAISVLVRVPRIPAAVRGWIPLIAGTAMAGAVRAQLPDREVGVKWPNDVLVEGRKLCGILAEGTTDPDAVVVGAGINTAMTAEELPVASATSFAVLGVRCDEDALVAAYLTALDRMLGALAAGDAVAAGIHRAVSATCLTLGREVTVSLPDGSALRGIARALEADGRLLVGDPGQAVSAGDVVHVR
ncbi:biotin--[acetyl-CoA-carboxylase] ligase [Microbacterium album]|uniref:biotin--[biotin carboxyl-carrier protein] ligase n=1 Tax=Microbacterium album TaxID=2053191 RepID=A0A917IC64_9MICO|nr:biotin--[acetyl-CoA-carboxylase] ligase [Microbacterium album]GGH37466.1 biotin--[acetyl-CoA-carboxylase] ligase [Microbacterium album]